MTSRFLRFLFVVIAYLVVDGHPFETSTFKGNDFELSLAPALNIAPIRNPSARENSKQLNYIADPFFPIVVLAHSLYEEPDFTYYLSLYELQRQKNYFLLI